jgi:hypothetical protein
MTLHRPIETSWRGCAHCYRLPMRKVARQQGHHVYREPRVKRTTAEPTNQKGTRKQTPHLAIRPSFGAGSLAQAEMR